MSIDQCIAPHTLKALFHATFATLFSCLELQYKLMFLASLSAMSAQCLCLVCCYTI